MSYRVKIEAPSEGSPPDHEQAFAGKDVWDAARRLVEHEDGLINNRLGWMFAFNGFLFAALGFTLSAEAISLGKEPGPSDFFEMLAVLRSAVGVVGVLVGIASWVGVMGAVESIMHVEAFYNRRTGVGLGGDQYLTGPGPAAWASGYAAIAVPVMMILIWVSWLAWLHDAAVGDVVGIAFLVAVVFLLLTVGIIRNAERRANRGGQDV